VQPERHLFLGRRSDGSNSAVELSSAALVRHVMALGASGSGKTVFCKIVVEEAVRRGIPAICVDPQGDLCSFAGGVAASEALEEHGVDPKLAEELEDRADVAIFTPGSARGIPLCADPIDPAISDLGAEARTIAISRAASITASLLGVDLDSDEGAGLTAVIDRAIHEIVETGARASLAALTEHLTKRSDADDLASYARYCEPKKIKLACQRLARLDVGARRSIFHGGVPIDIDILLGRDARRPIARDKTRIAVIYLNTLHEQEDKDFFLAALAERLYTWMLAHPSEEPQLLFYVDEVAPFVPPVRKPACKEALALLFKQARKYGVSCLMATQNPGDVDYRAMSQFGTWALGRLPTRQDLKKVEPTVKSLAPDASDAIIASLPSLKPGELVLISPDRFEAPVPLRTRWLLHRHETWNEDRIEAYADRDRSNWAAFLEKNAVRAVEIEEVEPIDAPADESPPAPEESADDAIPLRARRAPLEQAELVDTLAAHPTATAQKLASILGRHESTIRRALDRAIESGDVRAFRQGRGRSYYAVRTGGRPDLDLPPLVPVLVANLGSEDVLRLANEHARTRIFGMIGEDETLASVERIHRLVYKLEFEEKVERSLAQRIFGASHDERIGNVYLHPHNLGVLLFTNDVGIRFDDRPSGPASEIHDFDGVTQIDLAAPGALGIDDDDWKRRASEEKVRASFQARFDATPRALSPLFVPLFHLFYESKHKSVRRLTVDALIGRPVRWLPPA
jgi:hypothetical protein